jgi:hypothetical protein
MVERETKTIQGLRGHFSLSLISDYSEIKERYLKYVSREVTI